MSAILPRLNKEILTESSSAKILVVDDEKDILDFIKYNLEKENFEVYTCIDSTEVLELALQIRPHLILLDIMMPELDGVELCKILRAEEIFNETIIAFLTARGEDFSEIAALEAGGDDYIVKPIRPRTFLSRIRALIRRSKWSGNQVDNEQVLEISDLVINREKYQLTKSGEKIKLPKKEFEILWLLLSRPGKVYNRQEIFRKIWGSEVIVGERTIDVHIRKLREKIGPDYIKTIKGIGYKFDS